jgi:hypothetical protein
MEAMDSHSNLNAAHMTLSIGSPPLESTKVFRDWTARLRSNVKKKSVRKSTRSVSGTLPKARKVFVFTVRQVTGGQALSKARFVAWRHFGLGRHSRHRVSADILVSNKAHFLGRMYDQESTVRLSQALASISEKHQESRQYSNIRLLKIPQMIGLAIWLRGRAKKNDLVFPLESCVPEVKTGILYQFSEIVPSLQTSAKALISQSRSLKAKLGKKRLWKSD